MHHAETLDPELTVATLAMPLLGLKREQLDLDVEELDLREWDCDLEGNPWYGQVSDFVGLSVDYEAGDEAMDEVADEVADDTVDHVDKPVRPNHRNILMENYTQTHIGSVLPIPQSDPCSASIPWTGDSRETDNGRYS